MRKLQNINSIQKENKKQAFNASSERNKLELSSKHQSNNLNQSVPSAEEVTHPTLHLIEATHPKSVIDRFIKMKVQNIQVIKNLKIKYEQEKIAEYIFSIYSRDEIANSFCLKN